MKPLLTSFLLLLTTGYAIAQPIQTAAVPATAAAPAAPATPATPAAPAAPAVQRSQPLNLIVIATNGNRTLTVGELTDELIKFDIVCVGELHDSELHHQVQLQIIKELYARDESLGMGMEMFQRPFQNVVDSYFAGQISQQEFLKQTEYQTRWGFDWALYKPIVEFAQRNGVRLAALNAPVELTHRIMQVGYAGLTAAQKQQLGPVDFAVKAHHDYWFDLIPMMHGTQKISLEQQERTYEVMAVWDDYMAQSAAAFLKDRHVNRMVILAGSGHIDGGFGIPDRAAKYASASRATIKIVLGAPNSTAIDDLGQPTDYVIYVLPPAAAPAPTAK